MRRCRIRRLRLQHGGEPVAGDRTDSIKLTGSISTVRVASVDYASFAVCRASSTDFAKSCQWCFVAFQFHAALGEVDGRT